MKEKEEGRVRTGKWAIKEVESMECMEKKRDEKDGTTKQRMKKKVKGEVGPRARKRVIKEETMMEMLNKKE